MLADVHIFVQISAYGKQSPGACTSSAFFAVADELAWRGDCAEHLHLEEAAVLDHSIALFRSRLGLHVQRGAHDTRFSPSLVAQSRWRIPSLRREDSTPLPSDAHELRSLLVDWFLKSSTPDRPQLLGFEYECLRVDRRDGRAAASRNDEGPDRLVRAIGECFRTPDVDVEEFKEDGHITVLKLGPMNFSLEPGGQIEASFAPYADPLEVAQQIDKFVDAIHAEVADTHQIAFLGHQPVTMPQEIPLRAKPRYEIMNRRLSARGDLGIHMMRATAGMQVTLDTRSEADCASLLRAALVSAPVVTAMFANSPLVGGKPSGYLSFRESVWWDTDPSRCGIPPACLEDDADLGAYVDWALDAEPWFVRRDGDLREVKGHARFRDMIGTEWEPTLDDFSLHSTTLFPCARLRGGVEVRSADCVPRHLAKSFSALMAGIAYDEKARARASSIHAVRDSESLRRLHLCAARDGLKGTCGGVQLRDAAEELVDAARAGLERQVDAGRFASGVLELLRPLADLVASGETLAEQLLKQLDRGIPHAIAEASR